MSVGDPSDDSSSGGGDDVGFADTVTPVISPPVVSTPPTGTAPSTSVMGGRPESDKLVRAVSRAKIASKLFAKTEQVKLGRYHLLEMVGSGGMGVVWGAWDPELDRRVAIKLVKAEMQAARDRILLEGQALAKLSHPNVVPVYDVGVVDEQVYLVMEWVRGKNLRAFCKEPHTVREILAIYRSAGEGLSAAHRAGLIHRDFKPDNAILGDDGRVRVLDFGLARGEVKATSYTSDTGDKVTTPSSDLTRGAGTPRYMPPEQAEGKELSPAVDQYAFCVSLREALSSRVGSSKSREGEAKTARPEDKEPAKKPETKKADIPAWIDTILDRGTSQEAIKRFPSMDDLLRALARDPATIWRRRLAVVGAIGVAGAAFAIGTFRAGGGTPALETCDPKEQIASSWNDDLRTKVSAHLSTLGPYGVSEATRLGKELDGYAGRWADAHRGACLAKERKQLTEKKYTQNLVCLARTRTALDTMIGVLAKVDQKRLPDAVAAVGGLPNPARCLIETESSTIDPPAPEIAPMVTEVAKQVERGRVLALASADGAIDATAAAVRRAEELKYLPLVARANLEHGVALAFQGVTRDAVVALDRAMASALEANDNAVAVEAYARQITRVARTSVKELPPHAKDILGAIPVFESLAKGTDPAATFARALLYNNIGVVRLSAGERVDARAWFERARVERERAADANPELNIIWENLGLVADSASERDRLLGIANAAIERGLGRDHPNALSSRVNAAMLVANPERSLAMLREPCRLYQSVHPHLDGRVATCAFEAGWLADDLGRTEESRTFLAVIKFSPEEAEPQIAQGYLLMFDGHLAESIATLAPFIATRSASDNPWERFRSVDASLVLASSQQQLGRAREAVTTLKRALETLRSAAPQFDTLVLFQRRLARVEASLARLLAPTQPAIAAQHANVAIDWYRKAGGYQTRLAELVKLTNQ